MSILSNVPRRRLELIEGVVRAAAAQDGGRAAADFIREYYRGVGEDDLAARSPRSLAAIALAHRAMGRRRRRGESLVTVFNPDAARHGFESGCTLVAIVTDDMPFLVDSLGIVFGNAGIGVQLLIHPVLAMQRDAAGTLRRVLRTDHQEGAKRESWQLYEIDRQFEPAHLEALDSSVRSALADVRVAVEDFGAMRQRIRAIAQELGEHPPLRTPREETAEARSLLDWMAEAHFVFLGYRHYRLQRGAREDLLVPQAASGLGILRAERAGTPPSPNRLRGALRRVARDTAPLVITKANALATVHRSTHLDYIAVKEFDRRGNPVGEHRFLGLWTSTAYFASPRDIPLLRRKAAGIIDHFGLAPSSHDGKALLAVLETYPRDELFQASVPELIDIVRDVVNLYERRRTRLIARRDAFGRFWSCMVYVPRDRYTTEVRQRIEQIVLEAFHGTHIESQVQIFESNHARLHVVVRTPQEAIADAPDIAAIEAAIAAAATTWSDRLRSALLAAHEASDAMRLAAAYADAFPLSYQSEVDPVDALEDIASLETLNADPSGLRLNLHRPPGQVLARVHLKIARRAEPIPISDLLPVMENFGLRVISERPYAVTQRSGNSWLQDFELEQRSGEPVSIERIEQRLNEALLAVWRGEVANDGFNRLLLPAGLTAREIVVLRACCRYLLQTGIPFSQVYMESVIGSHPTFATDFLRLFTTLFDPGGGPERTRAARADRIAASLRKRLDGIASADEDRILRAFLGLILAMLRTNYYQRNADGSLRPALAFKLDPSKLPELPLPRPRYEIFVHSPRVEGVHLRMGQVARGGIRWSDRREDFRTEVLGLMKAQNVKNTLIVPVGAKGGFVPRQLPAGGSRDAIQKEGIAAYQDFIHSLLDLTDNIVDDAIVPPQAVVRRDADDPYLVVAADKGTASFSDIANAIATSRSFWLGDAFASGGSAGYDHKKMGITARGAWECVKRHFRELGIDTQSQDFTVAGIGDMSGDVFGNGMLLSKHARLVAAFNHQHIFLDPEPDAPRSFAERQRLFALPRSGWDDYDGKLLSRGGGVFQRSAKSVPLSPEAQKLLRLATPAAAPNDVIRAILRMPVDLLWNGGIGTYVKASTESATAAGDRSNDAVRIDGRELQARVVGEGGNLGFTQRGRVEYALAGGRINTDFIDNSAGVNTSDVEVNLKILTAVEERAGRLRRRDRDRLLAGMTDEVAALVLRNNYLQSQAISTLELQAPHQLIEMQHLIRVLERSGELNRRVEFLPDDQEIAERHKLGLGLTRPELAVLLAYSKITLNEQLIASDVPEDPYLSHELARYFPKPVQQRLARAIPGHRLRREIIATATTNSLVNRVGPMFVLRVQEDTGATTGQVARAYTVAREAFRMRTRWTQIEALDNAVPAAVQYSMNHDTSRLLRRGSYWLLRHRRKSLEIESAVRQLAPAVDELAAHIGTVLRGVDLERYRKALARHAQAKVPAGLASFMAAIESLDSAFDIVEMAQAHDATVTDAAVVYFEAGARVGLDWLRAEIDGLRVEGQWPAVARGGLRDAAQRTQRAIAENILSRQGRRGGRDGLDARIDAWMRSAGEDLASWQRMLTELRAAGKADFATLSVGVDAVRKFAT